MKKQFSTLLVEFGKSGEMGPRKGCFDWLPEGWKMEIRYRSTGKSDRFYIDPVSGYAFRSMNEVFCYLDTGKVGRRVFKHKDKDLMKQKSRNRPLYPAAKTGKRKTRKNSKAQKLHLKNQNTESVRNAMRPTSTHPHRCCTSIDEDVEDPRMQTVDLQKLASLLPWGSKERCTEFIFPLVGELVVNLRIENPVKITDNTREQMKIIPNHQYEGGEEESTDEHEGVHDNSENDDDDLDLDLDDVLTWSDDYILEEEEEHANPGVNENTGHEQEHQEIPLASASSSEGLWNDPCIEFAIKTLTGELPIDKDAKDTTNPGSLMDFHDLDSVETSTGNVNKEQAGGNVVLQQKCLTKGQGPLNWPTFADYRVTNFSWTNSETLKARKF